MTYKFIALKMRLLILYSLLSDVVVLDNVYIDLYVREMIESTDIFKHLFCQFKTNYLKLIS
jgi:hypothetical protein